MILTDLYTLEIYYGANHAAGFWSDLTQHYEHDSLSQALRNGDITMRRIYVGPDSGRRILYLTEQGRQKVQSLAQN